MGSEDEAEAQPPTDPEPEQAEAGSQDAGLAGTGGAVVAAENSDDNSDEATASDNNPENTTIQASVKDDKLFLQSESKSGASSLSATAVAFIAAAIIIQ